MRAQMAHFQAKIGLIHTRLANRDNCYQVFLPKMPLRTSSLEMILLMRTISMFKQFGIDLRWTHWGICMICKLI